MKIALDANAYSDWKRGIRWMDEISTADEVHVSATVIGELCYGFAPGKQEMANVATQSKQNAQDESLLAGMTATPATDEENKMLDALQGRAAGGRTAYKSGGKVADRSIEPLVQALMNKAKKAKKVSNKATEPLLNAHDDAIASALAVAQKSI